MRCRIALAGTGPKYRLSKLLAWWEEATHMKPGATGYNPNGHDWRSRPFESERSGAVFGTRLPFT